jgi:hypothetical protein
MTKSTRHGLFVAVLCFSVFSQAFAFQMTGGLLNVAHPDTSRYLRSFHKTRQRQRPNSLALADSNLSLVGEWAWGPCLGVQVQGTHAYIGNGKMFQVLDISNPANPTLVSEYNTQGDVGDIIVNDSLAYVCNAGLAVFNISNPSNPILLAQVWISGGAHMVMKGSCCYVLSNAGFVQVVDVSNPNAPQLRASMLTSNEFPLAIGASDTDLFVSNYPDLGNALDIYSIARPDTLININTVPEPEFASIITKDTLLFGCIAGGVAIYSIANPSAPYRVGLEFADSLTSPYSSSMAINGNYLYLSDVPVGVYVIDISNPSNPVVIDTLKNVIDASYSAGAASYAVSLNDGILCSATYNGVFIITVPTPDSLVTAGFFAGGGDGVYDIRLNGNTAMLALGSGGFAAVDISNPGQPAKLGGCGLDGAAFHITTAGNYAYVATGGVWIIDISNPHLPQRISFIPTSNIINDLAVQNNLLFVTVHDSGTFIFDLTNPSAPVQIGWTGLEGTGIAVQDTIAYLAASTGGLVLVDVGNPNHPAEITRILNSASGLAIRDSVAFVGADTGLTAVDISEPSTPTILSVVTGLIGYAVDISSSNNYVYFSSNGSLVSLDYTDIGSPKIQGTFNSLYGQKLDAANGYIYLCDAANGLKIIQNPLITSVSAKMNEHENTFRLYENYPDPFNPTTTLSYALGRESYVTLTIYDILGRKIETLLEKNQSEGNYSIAFNGVNLPSGVYFYRLEARGIEDRNSYFTQTKKMLILK